MKTLNEMLFEEMKNAEFQREYEAIQSELDGIRTMLVQDDVCGAREILSKKVNTDII